MSEKQQVTTTLTPEMRDRIDRAIAVTGHSHRGKFMAMCTDILLTALENGGMDSTDLGVRVEVVSGELGHYRRKMRSRDERQTATSSRVLQFPFARSARSVAYGLGR
jgi:hypothetical protein